MWGTCQLQDTTTYWRRRGAWHWNQETAQIQKISGCGDEMDLMTNSLCLDILWTSLMPSCESLHTLHISCVWSLKSEGVSCARVISERVSEVTCLIRPVWDLSPVRSWRMTRAPITDNIVISASLARPRPRHPAFQIPERASRLCSQHLKSLAFSSYLF